MFIFSQWYQRKERVVRVSFFFSAAAAAGAFGGILAYGIGFMDGVGGKRGWECEYSTIPSRQLVQRHVIYLAQSTETTRATSPLVTGIFILEGLLTIVIAFLAYFTIPHYPTKTKWFTPREVLILKHRLGTDSDAIQDEGFNWSGAKQAFADPKVYLYCFLFHGMSFALYTVSLFLPTIISGLGYKSWQSQLLTVPPYVFAFLSTMTTAATAKKVQRRAPFILGGSSTAILGYIVLITSPTIGGKYFAVFLCVGGIYSANALLLAWPSENVAGATKRNTALAMMISIGNCGAIIGTAAIYRQPLGSNANKSYNLSHGITIIWLCIALVAASTIWFVLGRENRRRAAILKDREARGQVDQPKTAEEIAQEWRELGDFKLDWKYQV